VEDLVESNNTVLKFKKQHELAILPSYAHSRDSGMDLSSVDTLDIPPGEVRVVSTGLSAEIPMEHEIQIRPRSGLAAKNGVTVLNSPGTVDSAFLGVIKVILINHGKETFSVAPGMRIAQAVLCRVERAIIQETEVLAQTERGTNGFGSSGV